RKQAALPDPLEAGELAVAVEPMTAGEDAIVPRVPVVRNDHSHARPDRTAADYERAVAADDGRVAHADPGHVSDRVQRTARQRPDRDSQVRRPHSAPQPRLLDPRRLAAPADAQTGLRGELPATIL